MKSNTKNNPSISIQNMLASKIKFLVLFMFMIQAQYTKDLSLENPKAPHIFTKPGYATPHIEVKCNIEVTKLGEIMYEVILDVGVKASLRDTGELILMCEIKYAALCSVTQEDETLAKKILFVDIPSFVFPYAREIISVQTAHSGFPSITLAPIDFAKRYQESPQNL